MSREDFYMEFLAPFFNFKIEPLRWHLLWKYRKFNQGDFDDHEFWFLCFYLYFRTLSKRGRDGKKYRKEFFNAVNKQV